MIIDKNTKIKEKNVNPISNDFYQLIWLMFRVDPLERITIQKN